VADGYYPHPLAGLGGEPAQGELDAGIKRVFPVAGMLLFQVGHQRPQIGGGRLHPTAGHLTGQQHQLPARPAAPASPRSNRLGRPRPEQRPAPRGTRSTQPWTYAALGLKSLTAVEVDRKVAVRYDDEMRAWMHFVTRHMGRAACQEPAAAVD
jgi:hypothetical protein